MFFGNIFREMRIFFVKFGKKSPDPVAEGTKSVVHRGVGQPSGGILFDLHPPGREFCTRGKSHVLAPKYVLFKGKIGIFGRFEAGNFL